MIPAIDRTTILVNGLKNDHSILLKKIDLAGDEIGEINLDRSVDNFNVKFFNSDRILGNTFSEDQNPDLYDINVFDWENPNPKYSIQGTRMIEITGKYFSIPHPSIVGRETLIDLMSGMEYQGTDEQEEFKDVDYPIGYVESNTYFEWFVKLLSNLGYHAVRLCEHLNWNEKHIISFYTTNGSTLENHICIIDKNGLKLFHHRLAKDLKGIGMDTFFVIENRVIFVDDQNVLSILHE